MRSPDGHLIDPNAGVSGKEIADTVQCCHCGMHIQVTKDTWKNTGWCLNCNKVRCTKKKCQSCVHWEKRMEAYEKTETEKRRLRLAFDSV